MLIFRLRNRLSVRIRRTQMWWDEHGEEAEKFMVLVAFLGAGYIVLVLLATR